MTERVQAIIDEEVGGEVTIQPENLFSEDLIVQHLSGQPRSSRRRVELVNEEPGFIFSFAFAIFARREEAFCFSSYLPEYWCSWRSQALYMWLCNL